MIRWPWIRRSRLEAEHARRHNLVMQLEERIDEMLFRVYTAEEDRKRALDGAAAANRREQETYQRSAQLMQDLRLVRVHFERSQFDGPITIALRLSPEMVYHGFRRDSDFRRVLAYLIEMLLEREQPELYRSLYSYSPSLER